MKRDIYSHYEQEILASKSFVSPTHGEMTLKEVMFNINKFMHEDEKARYEVVIGSDSQVYGDRVDFVKAIIVHRVGLGGIYMYQRNTEHKNYVLRDRMYQETYMSLQFAQEFMKEFEVEGMIKFDVLIHVDVGNQGDTRKMLNEVVGMIRGSGFDVRTKPESYGASSVADKHT